MATLQPQTSILGLFKTFRSLGSNKGVAWLSQIIAAEVGQSGEDALTVVNNKLESAGVLANGTADPVFASESALFFHNTTANRLFVRGTSAYTEVSADQNTGRVEIVYTATVSPPSPNVSWNYQTGAFTVNAGGGWSTTRPNGARWYVILVCPGDSNTVIQLNITRIDGALAEDIGYTPENTATTFLPSSVDNIEEALDAFDTQIKTLTDRPSGGGSGTDDQTASEVPTTTTGFNNNLSSADTNVQLALDTLDNLSISQQPSDWNASSGNTRILNKPDIPPFYEDEVTSPSGALTSGGNTVEISFTLPTDLTNYRTRYNAPLSIELQARTYMQASSTDGVHTYVLEVVNSADAALSPPITSAQQSSESDPITEEYRYFRAFGNLPNNISSGKVRVRLVSATGAFETSGVSFIRFAVRPDIKSDEIIVSRTDLGKNLKDDAVNNIEDLDDVITQVNDLPIQPAEFGSFANRHIDDSVPLTTRQFDMPIPRLVQELNARYAHRVRLAITYNSEVEAGSGGTSPTDRRNIATWNINLQANNTGNNLLTTGFNFVNQNSSAGALRRNHSVNVPANTTTIRATFTIPDTNDADVSINDFQYAYQEIIGTSGAGGTTDNYQSSIIYLAGATINDRLTQRSESINRQLIAGHTFEQYDELEFIFDAGPGSQPLIPCKVSSETFRSNGADGILWIQGTYWLMCSYQVDAARNKFRWRWGSPSNALRYIVGINTAS